MAEVDVSEVQEIFKLFDPDGSGIKNKEIGTVMRSAGVAASEKQITEFVAEAIAKDDTYCQLPDFLSFVRRANTVEAGNVGNVKEQMEALKSGCLHFFDKLPQKKIREEPPEDVAIKDIKHMLSTMGEKMTEEEIEEMTRELRATCRTQDGRVNFEDFLNLLK